MRHHCRAIALALTLSAVGVSASAWGAPPAWFANDSLGGTLARDHQTRAWYHAGKHRRTYVTYLDDEHYARVICYDHDTHRWSKAVKVDTCVAETGWCKGVKDGHNAPNLFISRDGFLHLFYGSHATPFKYARSKRPESIDAWRTGKRIGTQATYPYVVQTNNGDLLLFYRHGGAGGNSPLVVQRSTDGGRNWGPRTEAVRFGGISSVKIVQMLHDPAADRVHMGLLERDNRNPDKYKWPWYYAQYDVKTGHVLAMNGKDLGCRPDRKQLRANGSCMTSGKTEFDMGLHAGQAFFVFSPKPGAPLQFSRREGIRLVTTELPQKKFAGARGCVPWTVDGKTFRIYGVVENDPPTDFRGGDLMLWTSTDGGKTWSDGQKLVDRHKLGHGVVWKLNLVMNYAGDGPILVFAEPTGHWPKGLKKTRYNHYDNQSRHDRRLYAIDAEGRLLPAR